MLEALKEFCRENKILMVGNSMCSYSFLDIEYGLHDIGVDMDSADLHVHIVNTINNSPKIFHKHFATDKNVAFAQWSVYLNRLFCILRSFGKKVNLKKPWLTDTVDEVRAVQDIYDMEFVKEAELFIYNVLESRAAKLCLPSTLAEYQNKIIKQVFGEIQPDFISTAPTRSIKEAAEEYVVKYMGLVGDKAHFYMKSIVNSIPEATRGDYPEDYMSAFLMWVKQCDVIRSTYPPDEYTAFMAYYSASE